MEENMISEKTMLLAVEKYGLTRRDNINYGTNIPKVKFVLPTPTGAHVKFTESQFFFFIFDEKGIRIITTDLKFDYFFSWKYIEKIKITKILIASKLSFTYQGNKFSFQLNRFVVGNSWISTNTNFLDDNDYYKPLTLK